MVTRKPLDSDRHESHREISAVADDWGRQFVKHFEWQFLGALHSVPQDPSDSELQRATVQAVLAPLVESGMELESILELIGQTALEERSSPVVWNEALNRRRFDLIDQEIQGTITPAKRVELAGLTKMMRHQIDSELNLPLAGARSLHRKLLQLNDQPHGEPD